MIRRMLTETRPNIPVSTKKEKHLNIKITLLALSQTSLIPFKHMLLSLQAISNISSTSPNMTPIKIKGKPGKV